MKYAVALYMSICLLYSVQCDHRNFGSSQSSSSRQSNSNRWPFQTSADTDSRQYPSTKDLWSYLSGSNHDNDEDNVDTQLECMTAHTYRSSIPTGRTTMPYIKAIESLTTKEGLSEKKVTEGCIQACCDNAEQCQYAWVFRGLCFLVGCDEEKQELCEPRDMSGTGMSSTYIHIQLPETPANSVTETTESPTTIPQFKPTTMTMVPTTSEATTSAPNTMKELEEVVLDNQAPPTTPPPPVSTEKPISEDHGIIVAINGDTDITLPTNQAKIYGNTWPKPKLSGAYLYKWEKVAGPEQGAIEGKDNHNALLRDLVPGVYTLRLKVTNWMAGGWGEGFINVTVHSADHVNSPPIPVILPSSNEVITLPQDSIVLDAQSTTDDRGTEGLRFHWEEVDGPFKTNQEADTPVLKLTGLTEGVHQYKVIVTDADGASAMATAKVTVVQDKDYPPIAHAGNPVILHLPKNDAHLDGSASKDEGKLKYKWTYVSGPGGGDMEGANTAHLYVNHLTLGDHQYQLTVTDASGQSASDTVSVVVLAEDNQPPVASAGLDRTVVSPVTSVTLSGAASTDDYRISSFKWAQLNGPTDITLSGEATVNLTVTGLHINESIGSPTVYSFRLTVTDYRNLTNTDTVKVTYKKDTQIPPMASAGPDVNITLPQSAVILDGTGSHDDFGIVSYQWTKSMDSPAAGTVVDGSDKKPILVLSNLVNGTYRFTLKVTNKNGETGEDTVKLTVLPNPSDRFLLQVHVEGDISQFTQVDMDRFKNSLSHLLFNGSEEYDIHVVFVHPADTHIMVEFFAIGRSSGKMLNTTKAYYKLTENGQNYYYSSYHFLRVDMKVCQLSCSGHGSCDPKTRRCVCSTYWMENPFKAWLGRMESNCEWSVFYVVLVALGIVAVLLLFFWICCCCCLRRRRRARSKRRIRYAILDNKGDSEAMQMLPKDYQQTSLMVSESETEEEILFESSHKMLNNDMRKGGKNLSVKNGKIITGEDKVGTNQSSNSGNNNAD